MDNIVTRIVKRIIKRPFFGIFSYIPIPFTKDPPEYLGLEKYEGDKYTYIGGGTIDDSFKDIEKGDFRFFPLNYKHPWRSVNFLVQNVTSTVLTFYCLKKLWRVCLFAYDNFLDAELYFCTFSWYLLYEVEYVPEDFNVDDVDIWVRLQPLDFSTDGIHLNTIPMSSNLDRKPGAKSIWPAPDELLREKRPTLKVPPSYFHPKWFSSSDTFGSTDSWCSIESPWDIRSNLYD